MRIYINIVVSLLLCAGQEIRSVTSCYPTGQVSCKALPNYYQHQWVTCLTNADIQLKSRFEQHTCLDGSAKNCYYQCMLEKYNSEYGPVMPDCSCTKGAAVPPSMIAMRSPRIAVRSPIRTVRSSASCSNANYTSCNWYQDCLKARLPCQGLEVDYAIKEAKHFCQLYDNSYNTFSPNGQSWIDSVRTCLKSRLVYFTNPFWQYTCASIQQSSFASRKCCYTGGSSCSSFGAPSMCSLPIADWWKVFWTMANSFMTSATAAKESFRDVLFGMYGCGRQILINSTINDVGQVQLNLRSDVTSTYSSMSTSDEDSLALTTGNSIARQLKWDSKALHWFAYMVSPAELDKKYTKGVRIILGRKNNAQVSLDAKVRQLVSAVGSGAVRFEKTYNLVLDTIGACVDVKCTGTSITAKARNSGIRVKIQYVLAYIPVILVIVDTVKLW